MDWKVGEIKQVNGDWYQCVKSDDTCNGCVGKFQPYSFCNGFKKCVGKIFKKLKKFGEPFITNGEKYQTYITHVHPYILNEPNSISVDDSTILVRIKQTKEDMEEKNNGNTPLNVLTDKYVNGDICYDDFEKEVKALYSCKEEIKPTLKEFDLEAAKAGKPVCTRDGRKARIICFDAEGKKPLIVLSKIDGNEVILRYTEKGQSDNYHSPTPREDDLMMLPEKKEGWANVYKFDTKYKVGILFDNKEEARKQERGSCYIDTVKIEWEE